MNYEYDVELRIVTQHFVALEVLEPLRLESYNYLSTDFDYSHVSSSRYSVTQIAVFTAQILTYTNLIAASPVKSLEICPCYESALLGFFLSCLYGSSEPSRLENGSIGDQHNLSDVLGVISKNF